MPPRFTVSYYDQALKLLSNRPHAEKELRYKLEILSKKRYNRRQYKKKQTKVGYQPNVFTNEATPQDDQGEIDNAITKLKDEGFINDRSFAEWYCLQRQDYNPRSGRVLYMELLVKGVNPEIIKEVMRDYHSELQSCKDIALRKMSSMSRERLTTYLIGKVLMDDFLKEKGFRIDTINRTLKELPDFS